MAPLSPSRHPVPHPPPSEYPIVAYASQKWLLGQRGPDYWICLSGNDWRDPENWLRVPQGDAEAIRQQVSWGC